RAPALPAWLTAPRRSARPAPRRAPQPGWRARPAAHAGLVAPRRHAACEWAITIPVVTWAHLPGHAAGSLLAAGLLHRGTMARYTMHLLVLGALAAAG